jgi:hypothetical protein
MWRLFVVFVKSLKIPKWDNALPNRTGGYPGDWSDLNDIVYEPRALRAGVLGTKSVLFLSRTPH